MLKIWEWSQLGDEMNFGCMVLLVCYLKLAEDPRLAARLQVLQCLRPKVLFLIRLGAIMTHCEPGNDEQKRYEQSARAVTTVANEQAGTTGMSTEHDQWGCAGTGGGGVARKRREEMGHTVRCGWTQRW